MKFEVEFDAQNSIAPLKFFEIISEGILNSRKTIVLLSELN
jgi:hypothetical protein